MLNGLVERKALMLTATDAKLVAPDQQVAAVIQQIPVFLENGQFSRERYEAALRQRGLTPVGFENDIRQEIQLRALQLPLVKGVVVPGSTVDRLARLVSQQREVSWADITPAQFSAQAQVSDTDLESYYNAHKADFTDPEAARVEYVVLSKEASGRVSSTLGTGHPELLPGQSIQVRRAGTKDCEPYPDRRRTRAGCNARQKAKAKAEALLAEIRKNPGSFAELAKRESQDPGSAAHGGSLGSFPVASWSSRSTMWYSA